MTYKPEPMDTSKIELPQSLKLLVERLAQHVHDIWSQQRITEGWTWGMERNDQSKQHPDLVDYKDLPESEKEYDRNTATETIKAIMASGYRIEKS